ncbi:hypothetical protein [uncultured Clostridium sp.]|uniref:hypothetical protein n=1 Tax=uncultured Clostridium sp. TaxID=59620 RepID=UPI003216632F
MELFEDKIIEEYIIWQKANPKNFSWWNYVNMKSDIQIALGFAKFFYPEIIEIDNCIFIKDNFSSERYEQWKVVCNDKKTLEKAINSYEIKEFFHMNTDFEDKNINEQIQALGNILKKFWTLGFNERFPDMNIVVDIIEDDESLYITVFQDS